MEITIKPEGSQSTQIETAQGKMVLSAYETIELMENGQVAGYKITVQLKANGYTLGREITNKALELAGLSSFQAAQQTAKGYIKF